MKVHRTTRSNVLILIGGFLLACFLVALMPFLRNRSPILTPESIETAAKRLAPENAYFLVSDAVNALPNRPPPLVVPSQDNPKMTEKYVPASGSAAWLVNVERPDDDPEFIAYMKECEPSIEKVREALNSPYFLWPVDWKKPGDYARLLHGHDSQFWRIVESPGFMMARALQLLREGEEEAAVLHILDAFRFPVMLYSDGVQETRHAMWYATRGVLCLDETERKMSDAALRRVRDELAAIRNGIKPPVANVDLFLRQIDAKMLLDEIPPEASPGQKTLMSLERSVVQRRMRSIVKKHLAQLRTVVERPYPEARKWCAALREEDKRTIFAAAYRISGSVNDIAASYANARVLLDGAMIRMALELHRRAENGFPEKLDALAPKYLDSVPKDAFAEAPFRYARMENDYKLYSVGKDMDDNGGGTLAWNGIKARGDDIIIHWPREARD